MTNTSEGDSQTSFGLCKNSHVQQRDKEVLSWGQCEGLPPCSSEHFVCI